MRRKKVFIIYHPVMWHGNYSVDMTLFLYHAKTIQRRWCFWFEIFTPKNTLKIFYE